MSKFELGWDESHYMEVEAKSIEEAEEVLDKLAHARAESVATFQGIIGDINIWESHPPIEVSNSTIFDYNAEEFYYTVLD